MSYYYYYSKSYYHFLKTVVHLYLPRTCQGLPDTIQTPPRHSMTLQNFYLLEKHWKKRRKPNILILKHLLPIKVSSLPIFEACKFVSSALFFRVVWNQGEYSNCRKYATPQMLPVVNMQHPKCCLSLIRNPPFLYKSWLQILSREMPG